MLSGLVGGHGKNSGHGGHGVHGGHGSGHGQHGHGGQMNDKKAMKEAMKLAKTKGLFSHNLQKYIFSKYNFRYEADRPCCT